MEFLSGVPEKYFLKILYTLNYPKTYTISWSDRQMDLYCDGQSVKRIFFVPEIVFSYKKRFICINTIRIWKWEILFSTAISNSWNRWIILGNIL